MRTRKKKRSRKKIGTSLILFLAALLVPASPAADKEAARSYALIFGTVFQESGYAFRGAAVTLTPDRRPDAPRVKGVKKAQAVSDGRGEFAFRVPPGPMRYTLKVEAKGFESQAKPIEIQGEERVDVTFNLERRSK
ncbi:MAG TPA: carboxypeptidase-like regulatory domain-containing protein [Bryobacteraceae bacterium]|nr:carboxypeptidase-like regulatory domain-containing protein [Bryobacteraceae bacterium]